MPRILICNESISSGGIGTYTLSLAGHLASSGWEIGFVATHGPGEYYEKIQDISPVCMNLSSYRSMSDKFRCLVKFTKAFDPDILLLNHCSLAHYILPLLPRHVKPVAVLHNDVELFYRTAALYRARVFRWIAPSGKLNTAFRDYIPETLWPRIRTIQHGVDESLFVQRGRTGRAGRVVFIGNIGENKGADQLPAIIAGVNAQSPDTQFHIVGSGTLRAKIESECDHRNISVTFAGSVPPEKIPEILAEADILLLPSRVEGFGLVIVEAMMCGAVPVVSLLEGITDGIIDEGNTGFLVPSGDISGFVKRLVSLLDEPELFSKLSRNAELSARVRFPLSRMIEEYVSLFAEEDRREVGWGWGGAFWPLETLVEIFRKAPDGSSRVFRRIANLWKNEVRKRI